MPRAIRLVFIGRLMPAFALAMACPALPALASAQTTPAHDHWSRETMEARAANPGAGIPWVAREFTRVNWDSYMMDSCRETYGEGLIGVTTILAGRNADARRQINALLQAKATTPPQRFGLLLGLAGMRMIPPELFDGLVASLTCRNPHNRMRASELLGRMGDPRAVEPLREALRRETVGSVKIRMALHLAWLGEHEGFDTLAAHALSDPRWDVRGVACGLLRHVRSPDQKVKALAVLRERIRREDNQLAGAQVAGSLQVLEGITWKEVMQKYMPWQVEEQPPKAATVPAY